MHTSQFKTLRIEEDEEVSQFHARLFNLINSMRNLGEEISETKVMRKVLRFLLKRFRSKVTATGESKDVRTIKLEELIDSL